MTSTSFNVGLTEETRLSSRVLRPPGGGHTDIFGSEPEPARTGRRMMPNAAAAGGQLSEPLKKPAEAEKPTQNGDHAATPAEEPKTESKPVAQETKPVAQVPQAAAQAEPPKRVRVPPGGFSSGLW